MTEPPTLEHAALAGSVLAWCALACWMLVPLTRELANRLGIVDVPGPRKVHVRPTPRLGGVAVFLTFTATVLGGYLSIASVRDLMSSSAFLRPAFEMLRDATRVSDKLTGLLLGSVIVFAVGLLDDVLGSRFHPAAKAAGQLLAAAVVVGHGISTQIFGHEWLNVAVAILWIVGITNAFNFLDNVDGLSAGVASIASGVLLWNAWSRGEFFIVLILTAFLGSLLGFLRHNFVPATVFLGDCGSLFIGFLMATLTLLERYVSHASGSLFPVLMPILVLAIPLLDTATVIVIRLRQGRPLYVGDRCHLSHRLLDLGFSTRSAVLAIYLATFCFGLGAVVLPDASRAQSLLVLLQAVAFAGLLLLLMFHGRRDAARPPGTC
jgi:UDP-GlcNAc:undecaprenyl-phosphate GlcNAc-1-phosphate transferase